VFAKVQEESVSEKPTEKSVSEKVKEKSVFARSTEEFVQRAVCTLTDDVLPGLAVDTEDVVVGLPLLLLNA